MRTAKQYDIVAIVCMVFSFFSCQGEGRTSSSAQEGDTLHFRYADNIVMVDYGDYQWVELRNPWDTLKVLHTYVLVDKDRELPVDISEATVVRTPLSRTVVYTSAHCALVEDLGELESICGVCDAQYIMRSAILQRCASGDITDVGNGMTPNIEQIVWLRPDAILLSPFENSGDYGRFEKYGIPVIECADYMEKTALARAEWMRFYGRLYGVGEMADSMFTAIENRYRDLTHQVKGVEHRPRIMTDMKGGGAWYVPGGDSYIGQMYKDAGGDYAFGYLKESGSVPLSFETVYHHANNADVWFIKYHASCDKSYSDIANDYSPYTAFKAYRERNIYYCNTNRISYYDEIAFHPELLLEDYIKILHPGMLEGDSLRFFSKLAE